MGRGCFWEGIKVDFHKSHTCMLRELGQSFEAKRGLFHCHSIELGWEESSVRSLLIASFATHI